MLTTDEQEYVEYRYFTTNLVTNEVIAEIPFKGVSYERAIKAAGSFSGEIAVLPPNPDLNDNASLYDNTMPGRTGLYVMRNGVCVWGGIIWSRSYNVITRNLTVSASEFTSYFQHRRIWKTWGHSFGATLVSDGTTTTITLDNGSTYQLTRDSSVRLFFYDVANFKFNGYYKVLDDSATDGNGNVTFTTGVEHKDVAPGSVGYAIPAGTYNQMTVFVRTNTYDYVRSLVEAISKDFSGIEFANDEINPERVIENTVTNKLSEYDSFTGKSTATLTLADDTDIIEGQEFVVENVDPALDGLRIATSTYDNIVEFEFPYSVVISSSGSSIDTALITSKAISDQIATLTTATPHGLYTGQVVEITGVDTGTVGAYNGTHEVTVVDDTTFTYPSPLNPDQLVQSISPATIELNTGLGDNYVVQQLVTPTTITLTTATPHGYSEGDSVVVSNLYTSNRVTSKAVGSGTILYSTETPHGFVANGSNTVTVTGISDTAAVTSKTLAIDGSSANLTIETSVSHGLSTGSVFNVTGMTDTYEIESYSYSASTERVTFVTTTNHNLEVATDTEVTITGMPTPNFSVTSIDISSNNVTLTTAVSHNIQGGQEVTVSGYSNTSTYSVIAAAINEPVDAYVLVVRLASAHNLQVGQNITLNINGAGGVVNAVHEIINVFDDYFFEVRLPSIVTPKEYSGGTVSLVNPTAGVNGVKTVSSVTSNTIVYSATSDVVNDSKSVSMTVAASSNPLNTKYQGIISRTDDSFTLASTAYAVNIPSTPLTGVTASTKSIFNATNATVTASTATSLTYQKAVGSYVRQNIPTTGVSTGTVTILSPIYNVTDAIITSASGYTFSVGTESTATQSPSPASATALAKSLSGVTGTWLIASVPTPTTLTYANSTSLPSVNLSTVYGYATMTATPRTRSGTYGPFTANSDPLFEFSTLAYTGKDVPPVEFRGYEVRNVGEELDKYSDTVDGFEYRVDCYVDAVTGKFKRKFMLLPIDKTPSTPPAPGDPLPISVFGADKLVFEFPGNVSDLQLEESAENSATRFFMVGNLGEIGGDISQPYAAASALDLLDPPPGSNMGAWPLLDDDDSDSDTYDEDVLYSYADRYLKEGRPPEAKISVSVNGSVDPIVGTYYPGDWCSLIINDEFIAQRLANDLEPRDEVLVRKIDSYVVSVPDSVTFPEKVSLTLIPEWQVDVIGK